MTEGNPDQYMKLYNVAESDVKMTEGKPYYVYSDPIIKNIWQYFFLGGGVLLDLWLTRLSES